MEDTIFDSKGLAEKLHQGSLALFPTDTLPAIASHPIYATKLWEIKKRPTNKPLILMGSSQEELFKFVLARALGDAREMAEKFWPGALTMVLPATGGYVVDALNPGQMTIGMRVPACKISRGLLDFSGPMATTSANISGSTPSVTAMEAAKAFPGIPILGPVPWPESKGQASTVISWQEKGNWKVLRKGVIKTDLLNE